MSQLRQTYGQTHTFGLTQSADSPFPASELSSSGGTQATESSRAIADALAHRIGPHKFRMWFDSATFRVDRDAVTVQAANPFVARWIESNFSDSIRDAARKTLGRDDVEHVRVGSPAIGDPGNPGSAAAAPRASRGARMDETAHAATRSGGPTSSPTYGPAAGTHRAGHRGVKRANSFRRLEDFVVGDANRLAYSAVCAVAVAEADHRLTPVFIHGPCGVGKTHLLQGVVRRIGESWRGRANVRYVTAEQFTNEYIAAVRQNALESFRRAVRKLDVLAIDDVHFLSNKTRTQNEFLHTLDAISMTGARVVIASDSPPSQIRQISTALLSRLQAGMVARMDLPDRTTRRALIERIGLARGIRFTASAMDLLVARCVGSVRQIEGTMMRIAAFQSLWRHDGSTPDHQTPIAAPTREGDSAIGRAIVERVLTDAAPERAAPVRMPAVIDAVCARMNVSRADLFGNGRHHMVVLARSLVAYLGRELTTLSFPEIAAALGRKNHSTVHTADQRVRKQLEAGALVAVGGRQANIPLAELTDQLRHALERGLECGQE